tara:strand:+ start:30 stop:245 length:216 start_codon:yes stop_codon:yes gene_type:complete
VHNVLILDRFVVWAGYDVHEKELKAIRLCIHTLGYIHQELGIVLVCVGFKGFGIAGKIKEVNRHMENSKGR